MDVWPKWRLISKEEGNRETIGCTGGCLALSLSHTHTRTFEYWPNIYTHTHTLFLSLSLSRSLARSLSGLAELAFLFPLSDHDDDVTRFSSTFSSLLSCAKAPHQLTTTRSRM